MKTLLEWLENNSSTLKDGIYHVGEFGNLICDGVVLNEPEYRDFELISGSYVVKNNCITEFSEWYSEQCKNERDTHIIRKTASDYLKYCADLLSERGQQYDKSGKERSMEKIVRIFNDMTGQDLTTVQGWYFMQLLKDVRFFQNMKKAHADSLLDKISYAALMTEEALKDDE